MLLFKSQKIRIKLDKMKLLNIRVSRSNHFDIWSAFKWIRSNDELFSIHWNLAVFNIHYDTQRVQGDLQFRWCANEHWSRWFEPFIKWETELHNVRFLKLENGNSFNFMNVLCCIRLSLVFVLNTLHYGNGVVFLFFLALAFRVLFVGRGDRSNCVIPISPFDWFHAKRHAQNRYFQVRDRHVSTIETRDFSKATFDRNVCLRRHCLHQN